MKPLWIVIALLIVFVAMEPVVASDEVFPKPMASDLPMYPERARLAHVAGTVKVWFILDANGEVARAGAISGNSMLRDETVRTVKTWKFQRDSVRPDVRHQTEFVYVLNVQPQRSVPKLTVSMADYRRVDVISEFYVEAIE